MSKIEILNWSPPHRPDPPERTGILDQLLDRKSQVLAHIPPHQSTPASSELLSALTGLIQQEGRREPYKLMQAAAVVERVAVVGCDVNTRTIHARVGYRREREESFVDYVAYAPTLEDAREYLRDAMLKRKGGVCLVTPHNTILSHLSDCIEWVFQTRKSGAFNDQIYLKKHCRRFSSAWSMSFMGLDIHYTAISYSTTLEQEEALYRAVDAAIGEMQLQTAPVYHKIQAVYSYIVKNTRYDETYQRYSAYNAMIEHCAVCQGYALLFYLFMRKLNVDVEYIYSKHTEEGAHAWNLVRLGAYWYNIDATWERFTKLQTIELMHQDCLLKCDADFGNHVPDDCFRTEEFLRNHPKASNSI